MKSDQGTELVVDGGFLDRRALCLRTGPDEVCQSGMVVEHGKINLMREFLNIIASG
jgi:hypothetical protein